MLIQFSVGNFKTFKGKATLSLVASNYDKQTREEDNVLVDKKFDLRVLKSAVIYGANASGKSKFMEAFRFMKNFVTSSSNETQKGQPIGVESFKLNTETENAPSEFEAIFICNKIRYRYGFQADSKKIVSEWFYCKDKTKEVELFYRDFQKFETHPKLFTKGATVVKEGLVRDNALLLSTASQFNDERASIVLTWFQDLNFYFQGFADEAEFRSNTISKVKDVRRKAQLLELVRAADLGIQDIFYKEFELDSDKMFKELSEGNKRSDAFRKYYIEVRSDISTIHKKYNNKNRSVGDTEFKLKTHESDGTQKFFYLTGPVLDALEKGKILIADELESSLHPNLVNKIVLLFNSKDFNPKGAQLIFTTHNTNLLSAELFRRDQVWFVEKDRYGEGHIYSLNDFKAEEVRKNEAFEDNYLRGKYGAVPYTQLFHDLIQEKPPLPNGNKK